MSLVCRSESRHQKSPIAVVQTTQDIEEAPDVLVRTVDRHESDRPWLLRCGARWEGFRTRAVGEEVEKEGTVWTVSGANERAVITSARTYLRRHDHGIAVLNVTQRGSCGPKSMGEDSRK